MKVTINEILINEKEGSRYRVLWIDSYAKICYLIDVQDKNAWPFKCLVDDIIEELINEELTKSKTDQSYPVFYGDVPEVYMKKRDEAWNFIESLVTQEPGIYEKSMRNELMQKIVQTKDISRVTLIKYLRRYWQRGKTMETLLPDYNNSGGRGKDKGSGEQKRGRPPIYGYEGINIDEDTKKIFRVTVEKHYLNTKKNSLTHAYQMMIREFYVEDSYIEEGEKRLKLIDKKKLPTLRQFRYWFNKEYNNEKTQISRQGPTIFAKDFRAILGSSTEEAWGPGSLFQIDATVADVYLISRFNSNWIIGRPVLYLVVDVFSRMIAGIYIGLEGPSWMGAMMALANTASDKVSFCARFGITIKKDEWPCSHLPETLLADRGELEGYNVERLISAFNLHVENTAPYRADWKGIVEKQFSLVQTKVKPFLPGYIDKDFQTRGARDYRLDAALTLEQFTSLMIRLVLKHNNEHYLANYLRDEEMIVDSVVPIPINLWNWGVENRSGKLRYYPEQLIRLKLLPQYNATVTSKGINFHTMLYGSDTALKEGWFSLARQKRSWKVKISYDPRDISLIYLWHNQDKQFEECRLLEHQQRYIGASLDEVLYLLSCEKQMASDSRYPELQADVNLIEGIQKTTKEAIVYAKQNKDTSISKKKQTGLIRENRAREREEIRRDEAFSTLDTQLNNKPSPGSIITFGKSTIENYDKPSIKEFMNRGKKSYDD